MSIGSGREWNSLQTWTLAVNKPAGRPVISSGRLTGTIPSRMGRGKRWYCSTSTVPLVLWQVHWVSQGCLKCPALAPGKGTSEKQTRDRECSSALGGRSLTSRNLDKKTNSEDRHKELLVHNDSKMHSTYDWTRKPTLRADVQGQWHIMTAKCIPLMTGQESQHWGLMCRVSGT